MRNAIVRILSAVIVGWLGMPAWAQPLPEPTPLGNPTESPPQPPITSSPPIIAAPEIGGSAVVGGGPVSGGVFTPVLGTADPCCAPAGHWTGGGGLYVMQPFFSTNPAFLTSTSAAGGTVRRQQDFGQKLDVAPIAFLGYTWSNGLGVRGRWFQFEGNGQASGSLGAGGAVGTVTPPTGAGIIIVPPASTITATDSLHVHVYDLEFTYTHGTDCWSLLYSAGARYATMSQSYQLDVASGGVPNTFIAAHNFGGAGPTVSIEGRYRLGDTHFGLYGSARGSLLFGSSSQNSGYNSPDNVDLVSTTGTGSGNQTIVLPIGEVELGAEWSHTWNRFRFFAQAGVVGQIWWGGGNPSQSLTLSTGPGSTQTNNFGFLGGVLRAGVDF